MASTHIIEPYEHKPVDFVIIGGGCYGSYHSGQVYKAIQKGKLAADTRLIIVDRNETSLAREQHAGKPNFVFVQADWLTYLLDYFDPALGAAERYDSVQIVPAPFAPHLMFDWLLQAVNARLEGSGLRATRTPFDETMALPYEYTDPKAGNHFISRAGWRCPTACIEPTKCPAVRDVRDWDLQHDLITYVAQKNRTSLASGVAPSRSAATMLATATLPNGVDIQISETSIATENIYSDVITFTCHHYVHGIGTTPARQLYEARERVVAAALAYRGAGSLRFAIGTVSHCHGVVATLTVESST